MSVDSPTQNGHEHEYQTQRGTIRKRLIEAIRDRIAVSPRGDGVPRGGLVAHVARECEVPGYVVEDELGQAIRDGDCYYVGGDRPRYKLARRRQRELDAQRAADRVRAKRGGGFP